VFSNGVAANSITDLQEWLEAKGFVVTDTKERVSAHLLHHGANASYGLSFIKKRWVSPAGCGLQMSALCVSMLLLGASAIWPPWRPYKASICETNDSTFSPLRWRKPHVLRLL
jgi:hypothetical protein